jgi:hypothetical protein
MNISLPIKTLKIKHGLLDELLEDPFPTRVYSWDKDSVVLPEEDTHFGYVHSGSATLICKSGNFQLQEGMYFSLPGWGRVVGEGVGIVVSRLAYKGFFYIGGPAEVTGRLRYIDGCTDSLLIPPVILGEPCLNLLHIPKETDQSQHTHSSVRLGIIASGSGSCETPAGSISLYPGLIFLSSRKGYIALIQSRMNFALLFIIQIVISDLHMKLIQ